MGLTVFYQKYLESDNRISMQKKTESNIKVVKSDIVPTSEEIDTELEVIYKTMNDKWKLYIKNYLSTNNKGSAARASGFTGASIESYIYTIHNEVNVKRAIQLEKLKIFRKLDMTNEEILREIAAVAKSNVSDYMEYKTVEVVTGYKKNGEPLIERKTILTLKDSNTIPYETMGALKSIKQNKDGRIELILFDKTTALMKLAEYSGLFNNENANDIVSKVLSDITVQGIEISLKVMKLIEEKEVSIMESE